MSEEEIIIRSFFYALFGMGLVLAGLASLTQKVIITIKKWWNR